MGKKQICLLVFRQICFADFAHSNQPYLSVCVCVLVRNICSQVAKILRKKSYITKRKFPVNVPFFSSLILTYIFKVKL